MGKMQNTEHKYHNPRPLSKQFIVLLAVAFFATGVIVAALLHYWNNIRPSPQAPLATDTEQVQEVPSDLLCEDGWKAYERDAIKLGFCYPEKWGNATLVDAKITEEDEGRRWLINFEANSQVTVGLVSGDWSTQAGRGGACYDPTKQEPDYEAFSDEWQKEGGTISASSAQRGLEVRPGYYLIDETASEYLDGACLRGVVVIPNHSYPTITASYYRKFGGGIINAGLHVDNPVILVPVDDRADFIQMVRSIRAL